MRLASEPGSARRDKVRNPVARVLIGCVRAYQRVVSPLLPDACIYNPTCSEYAVEAIEKYGVCRGCRLAIARILRCNPLHVGGYDPVP